MKNVIDAINFGCALISTTVDVAPYVKNYMSKKDSKKNVARRASLQATVETDDEEEEERTPTMLESSHADG